ncbi:MFS transporter [Buttiauxella gaviniae]|uniref:MFS transporter n=1 Tax=Buttiauxella gaviniae TaxID=82990 RepID=UPI003C7507B9
MKKNHSLMIFLLFLGYVIVYIDKTVMGFALLPIEKEFGVSTQQLGYITGIFFLSYSLFQIPAGWLNDRIGFRSMLVASLCLLGGFALCFGVLGLSFGMLIVFRFLAGIGHSGYPCSCAKAVVSNFSVEKRTFAQSILLSSAGLAMTIGPMVAVSALTHIGWRGSFAGLGLMACAVAIVIFMLVQKPAVAPKSASSVSYRTLLKSPTVILLFIAIFCINIPSYGLMAWLPKFLVQQRHMPLEISGLVIAAGGLGIWISSLGTGWLVGKYFQGREPGVIVICSLISSLCIFAIYHTGSPVAASVFLFLGQVFLMGSFVTVFTLPMKRLPVETMGAAMGLINTGGTLGGFVSPIVMGYLIGVSQDYYTTFIFLALAMVCAALAVIPLLTKKSALKPITD